MEILDRFLGQRYNGWRTRPWRTRLPGGIYITHSRAAWVYRVLPTSSLDWEDPPHRLLAQSGFERMLIEIGETSRDLGQGTRALSQNREMHVVSLLADEPAQRDPTITPTLARLHSQILPATSVRKIVLVGVKLRRDAVSALMSDDDTSTAAKAARALRSLRDDDASSFSKDLDRVNAVMSRAGCTAPTDSDLRWLESWFSDGSGTDVALAASDTRLRLPSGTGWQISAFMEVEAADMWLPSPSTTWALDAMNHPDGADVISARFSLEPATVTRGRLRRSQRIIASQEAEEEATKDVARDELAERRHTAKDIENYVRSAGHAWLTDTSVLFARRLPLPGMRDPDETFADALRNSYGMSIKPLEKRQQAALAEMLPGDGGSVNPFNHDCTPAWLAYSGITGFGTLGDDSGALLGDIAPHFTPIRIDHLAAAKKNAGPAWCVFGRPGSGKTWAAQYLAGQMSLNGVAAILINPKGHDSLAPFAAWITAQGGQAQVVSLSRLEAEGGAFDPWRFCADPRMAAEILGRHIVAVLGASAGGGLTGRQETELERGLAEGADKGARCAAEAIAYIRDEDLRSQILDTAESNSLFRLGIGFSPRPPWGAAGGFTLIEFDREMAWPTPGKDPATYDRTERVAVAALRLVSRASLEILMRSDGGVLVVDEAHHFLASAEGRATVDRINREGRSLRLLPIFCTQQVTDLVNDSAVDMETFISRVLVLRLPKEEQATAALTLCGLDPTPERIDYLRRSPSGWGFFRDMDDRHGLIQVGAGVSKSMHLAMSTNYTDRRTRDEEDDQ